MSSAHGYTIPEAIASEPAAAEIADLMHAAGVDAAAVNEAFEFAGSGISDDFSQRDAQDLQATESELRTMWGNDYDANVATIRRYVQNNMPDDIAMRIANARGKDGRAVFNDPRVVIPLLGLAQRAPTFDKGDGSLEAQIAAIETLMRDDRQRYFADPALQLRARRLYAQRDGKKG